jgi:hypothetical protein
LKKRVTQTATAVFSLALSFLTGIGLTNTAGYLEAKIFSVSDIEVAPVKIEDHSTLVAEPEYLANGRAIVGGTFVEVGKPVINYSETKGQFKIPKNLIKR